MYMGPREETLERAHRDSVSIIRVANSSPSSAIYCVLKTNGALCATPGETMCGSSRSLSWGDSQSHPTPGGGALSGSFA